MFQLKSMHQSNGQSEGHSYLFLDPLTAGPRTESSDLDGEQKHQACAWSGATAHHIAHVVTTLIPYPIQIFTRGDN